MSIEEGRRGAKDNMVPERRGERVCVVFLFFQLPVPSQVCGDFFLHILQCELEQYVCMYSTLSLSPSLGVWQCMFIPSPKDMKERERGGNVNQ